MIEYFKKAIREGNLEKINKISKGALVKAIEPTDKEINLLIKELGLKKDNILDGLDSYEMPRVEQDGKDTYIFLRAPTNTIENEPTSSFLIIITEHNLIIISKYNLEIFDKIIASPGFFPSDKSKSVLQALFYVFNAFSSNVRRILKDVKRERGNIKQLKETDIFDLILQEDILNDYLFSFSPLIDMYAKILKIKSLNFKANEKDFIEDLVVDLNQTFNTCKISLKTISNMRDYYSTTLSNRLNRIITILTIFTIFLTIPTLISSIYGMNIKLPFQNINEIFLLLTGITFITWVVVFIIFKRNKII